MTGMKTVFKDEESEKLSLRTWVGIKRMLQEQKRVESVVETEEEKEELKAQRAFDENLTDDA